MGKKAWKISTSKGAQKLKYRLMDALAGVGFQLGCSAYYELYKGLAYSNQWVEGTFERLYRLEKNPRLKEMFRDYVQKYVCDRGV